MPFDPDAYLASKLAPSFDPDAYLASKTMDPTKVTSEQYASMSPAAQKVLQDKGEALATQGAADKYATDNTPSISAQRGAAQGATFGLGDEAKAGLQTLSDQVQGDSRPIIDNYRSNRDLERQTDQQAELTNPKSYLAGKVAGGVAAGSVVPGGLVAQGALQGLGDSKSDLTQGDINGAVKDTAIGGLVGKAIGSAGELASQAANLPGIKSIKNAILDSRYAKALSGGADVAQYGKPKIKQALESDVTSANGNITPDLQKRLDDLNTYDSFTGNGGMLQKVGSAIGAIKGGLMEGPVGAMIGYKGAQEALSGEAQRTALTTAGRVINGVSNGVDDVMSKVPQQYQSVMQNAVKRGGNAVAVQHFLLSQKDPNYAKAFDPDQSKEDNQRASQPQSTTGAF